MTGPTRGRLPAGAHAAVPESSPAGASMTIRPERAGEEAAVRAINEAAFGNAKNGRIVDGIRGTDRWIDLGMDRTFAIRVQ